MLRNGQVIYLSRAFARELLQVFVLLLETVAYKILKIRLRSAVPY